MYVHDIWPLKRLQALSSLCISCYLAYKSWHVADRQDPLIRIVSKLGPQGLSTNGRTSSFCLPHFFVGKRGRLECLLQSRLRFIRDRSILLPQVVEVAVLPSARTHPDISEAIRTPRSMSSALRTYCLVHSHECSIAVR